ncbi:unnamed protein product, partial [Gadus morhua 'NCC']
MVWSGLRGGGGGASEREICLETSPALCSITSARIHGEGRMRCLFSLFMESAVEAGVQIQPRLHNLCRTKSVLSGRAGRTGPAVARLVSRNRGMEQNKAGLLMFPALLGSPKGPTKGSLSVVSFEDVDRAVSLEGCCCPFMRTATPLKQTPAPPFCEFGPRCVQVRGPDVCSGARGQVR